MEEIEVMEEKQVNEEKQDNAVVYAMDEKFRFSCHPEVECFGRCCRDINIFLTPYDLLRIKNKLAMESGEFLERYTQRADQGNIPLLVIKMREEDDLKCPFLTSGGCSIYEVRPWSCRIAPVDLKEDGYSFIFDSDFCKGQLEGQEWTVKEWMQNQDLEVYEKKEKIFNELPQHIQFSGMINLDRHIKEIIFMACYDLDRFRRFILETYFIDVFFVKPDVVEKVKKDDEALLQFSFKWLKDDFDVGETMDLMDEWG